MADEQRIYPRPGDDLKTVSGGKGGATSGAQRRTRTPLGVYKPVPSRDRHFTQCEQLFDVFLRIAFFMDKMVFSNLPAELQVEIFYYLHRPALERMSLVNRQSNEIVKHYERLWPLHRLTLVISGESHLYRLHNFDAGMTLQVTRIAFYRLLRKSQIEFILLTEDPVNPLMNLDHLPRQLFRFRRYWTDATVDFRQLPITRTGPTILASHHRHRVAEARMTNMHPPTPRLIEYLRQPRTDGGSGRRLLLVNDYMNPESPPPGPYAVIVLQPKEQWND